MAEIVEILIKTVSNHPELYNVTLQDYRNPEKRVNAWQSISASVGLPADECRKRWKSLRDTYRREKRKEAERRRSGTGASSARPWRYSGVMGFLNPFLEDRPTSSNMVGGVREALTPEEREDAMTGHSQAAHHHEASQRERSQFSHSPSPRPASQSQWSLEGQAEHTSIHIHKKRPHGTDFEERLLTALEAVSRRASPPSPPPEDSDSLFFKSLLEDFRTLSFRKRQDLKFQIHRLVYEAKCLEAPGTPPASNQVQTKCEEAPVLTQQSQTNNSMGSPCSVKSETKNVIARDELRVLERPHDEDELFLLSFVPTLKRLSPQKSCAAKIKIQQIMYDVEFDE